MEKSKTIGITLTSHKVPRVVIGPGAVVEGPLKFERKGDLYVSDRATIGPGRGCDASLVHGRSSAGLNVGGWFA